MIGVIITIMLAFKQIYKAVLCLVMSKSAMDDHVSDSLNKIDEQINNKVGASDS